MIMHRLSETESSKKKKKINKRKEIKGKQERKERNIANAMATVHDRISSHQMGEMFCMQRASHANYKKKRDQL